MPFGKRVKRYYGGALPDALLSGIMIVNDWVTAAPQIPPIFSLRNQMPPVMSQLNFNCVGAASQYLGEFFEQKETSTYLDFSAMAIFSLAKLHDGLPREAGTYLSNATYIPMRYGYFYEKDYPERGGDLYEIKEEHKTEALKYKVRQSVMVDYGLEGRGFKEMLFTLQTPIIVGFNVHDNFKPDDQGVIPLPQGKTQYGHAVTLTGFDDARGMWEILNSWGKGWGRDGYAYFPYGFPFFATAWTAYDAPNFQPIEGDYYGKPRNLFKEQRNAELLKEAIYKSFAVTDRARLIASKFWFIYTNAITYSNYTIQDIINDLYHYSRKNSHIWNFKHPREQGRIIS